MNPQTNGPDPSAAIPPPTVPGGIVPPQAGAAAMPAQAKVGGPGTVKAGANPNSTQNALQIAEIRDGIVIMKDGSFRSVVMVKAINFDLMSPEERESVEFSYQVFLNSLYFPIQIFIHSEKIDINPYMDMLQKIRNEQSN